jgi:quinolinate synthase
MRNQELIIEKINVLRKKRNAVILAHNYELPEIQDIADFTGDSLSLCQKAASTKADVIVFCGVWFMAESAAIINPGKTVLLPDAAAGCPMADMATAERLLKLKTENPGAVVVCYVNSNAEVKALSDVSCTSSNAQAIIESIPKEKTIIFVPDKFLGGYIARTTGRDMILWPGFCPTHQKILPEHIAAKKTKHPGAKVLVHPECSKEVTDAADFVGSTGQIIKYCRSAVDSAFIIGTENGILHMLRKENPGKEFIPASDLAICPNMKKITLEKVEASLETLGPVVKVPGNIATLALIPIERMLAINSTG